MSAIKSHCNVSLLSMYASITSSSLQTPFIDAALEQPFTTEDWHALYMPTGKGRHNFRYGFSDSIGLAHVVCKFGFGMFKGMEKGQTRPGPLYNRNMGGYLELSSASKARNS
eukprot:4102939-Amphidinium_carterae.1